MSQAYQDSANCKLELKFAQQSGKAIVPVLIEAGYTRRGWLGIITAGALYIELHDQTDFASNVNKLVVAIYRTLQEVAGVGFDDPGTSGTGGSGIGRAGGESSTFGRADPQGRRASAVEETDDGEEIFSVAEMRGELVRLAADMGDTKAKAADADGSRASGGGGGGGGGTGRTFTRCALPAVVPTLPPHVRVTTEMKQLLANVLTFDETAAKQEGFCGMASLAVSEIRSSPPAENLAQRH